jgi:Dolichyl-phosphate-mannose-protein mannosyltransferase
MTGLNHAPRGLPRYTWPLVFAVAMLCGAALRLDQFGAQVLIDDEWHAVHQVLQRGPAKLFLDFGFSDYSIPLGIYDWMLAHSIGLSETAMRMPMLLCGLATLVLFPLFAARRLGSPAAALFAVLLAMSPLLVLYSRMARPYAITLLLGWIAHVAFHRYLAAPSGRRGAGVAYAASASLAAWFHPIVAPFVLAPFLWALWQVRTLSAHERRGALLRLLRLALPTGVAMAALLLPPLLANPVSMSLKSGVDLLDLGTLVGVWFAWLGTPSALVVVLCLALAACGAGDVWQRLPEARSGILGIVLTLLALVATRPMWSFMPLSVARYLLPFLPLLLLAVAVGSVRVARMIATPASPSRRIAGLAVALLPCVALASQSPLPEMLRRPNAQTLHLAYHFDFRRERNPALPHLDAIPLSPFWTRLAAQPSGGPRVAVAPFYFESYDWDAPRWENLSGRTVVPGYLTGLCMDQRWGEVPPDARYRFDNAVHLAEGARLAQRGIDYVVWQKPYMRMRNGEPLPIGGDTAWCERTLFATFGTPAYEDDVLIAFRIPSAAPPHAAP